ncbi:Serine/threonine protein phosphatase PrpC [Nannocystis exedens]|uniref:Serine/threonine protein phosphatase PrpC n=1 Tax=Nannocystis exedens TaxID=54 RepID=A0A1I1W779_9BACT|nr:PP2C family serine/threonine-protein phosphatase [Nannocystis exedens]PCC67491.1 protein-serine/threonine phosphatase [Nannocystis exedens]SFD90869.1 Serine/threonine protein phosphatase PrpC [Nannocystis exedens]
MAQLEVFARTEVGCVRKRNEDHFVVQNLQTGERGLLPHQRVQPLTSRGTLIAVCDGMGGAAAGDVASALAVDVLSAVIHSKAPFASTAAAQEVMQEAITAVNDKIRAAAVEDPARHGMGTTLTAALAFGPELLIGHVGDSRAYIRRGRSLTQITTDHSVVGQLIAAGRLRPDQARDYEHRNVLLQALGVQPRVGPEFDVVQLRAGDVLLLCSDGLTGPVTDEQILGLMLRYEDPLRCCRALTEAACAAGGPDNVTVAIARFSGEGLELPHGREEVAVHRVQVAV